MVLFIFLYDIVSGQLALLLLINDDDDHVHVIHVRETGTLLTATCITYIYHIQVRECKRRLTV